MRVTAQVERSTVTPGKSFELRVEVDRLQAVQFELPEVAASIQGLVVLDQRTEGPERVGRRTLETRVTKLKAPLQGTYLIPGVEAPWLLPPDRTGTAGTGPILIEAARTAGEEGSGEESLRDLKPSVAPDTQLPPAVYVGAAVLLLLGILAILWWRRQATASPEEIPLPPGEAARLALAALRRSAIGGDSDQGAYAFELSAVLRRYLEGRFGFLAWRMTTSEVLRAMPQELAAQRRVSAAIREVLEATDRLKFGRQPVPEATLEAWSEAALEVVSATEAPILEEAS